MRHHRIAPSLTALGLLLAGAATTALAEEQAPPEQRARMIDEVVVTARRREESLQETPVAISAFSADQLQAAGVHKTTDLEHNVPGLSFGARSSKSKTITVRGVGQREATPVLDPGVSVYLNNIFIPRQDAQLLDTIDIENIQVLRGPQGTLFGKNTIGGAILVDTKRPDFDVSELRLQTRIGNNGRRDGQLSGNIPLMPGEMGMRFAVSRTQYDGFIDNTEDGVTFGDEDRLALAARLLWDVSERFTVDMFGYWSRLEEQSGPLTCVFQDPGASVPQLKFPNRPDYQSACEASERAFRERRKVSLNSELARFEIDSTILALTLSWVWGEAELKSITGWSRQSNILDNASQEGTGVEILNTGTIAVNDTLRRDGRSPTDESRNQISQELQFNSNAFAGRLNYTLGLFASLETIRETPDASMVGPRGLAGVPPSLITGAFGPGDFTLPGQDELVVFPLATFFGTISDLDNRSAAAFAQGTYDFTSWLQLTLGARYTWEERKRDITSLEVDTDTYGQRIGAVFFEPAGVFSPITVAQFDQLGENPPNLPLIVTPSADVRQQSWTEFTPSATLSVFMPDNWLFNSPVDSLMGYVTYSEGFKAGGFEPRGVELVAFDPERVKNIELGLKLDALDGRLRLNGALYHMAYENIQVRVAEQGAGLADILFFLSNAAEATVRGAELEGTLALGNWLVQGNFSYNDAFYDDFMGQVVTPLVGEDLVDRSDEPFQLVPEITTSVTLQYQWETRLGAFIPRLTYIYRDELFTGIDFRAVEFDSSTIPSQELWNARLAWVPDERLRLTAFVNNLTDEQYFASGFAVSDSLGAAPMQPGESRTFGLEMDLRF